MRILNTFSPEAIPSGKRSIRRTVYGNINGYVGGRRWTTFGESYDPVAEERAKAFLAGASAEELF